jgi:5'-phosphate synthase pdxT subunit
VPPRVGVLALQGAFAAHARVLAELDAQPVEVRTPTQLERVDALVMPGGESTTMSLLLESSGLFDPIAERLADGLPVLGTCAGMILLATEVLDGRADQRSFGAIDLAVRRNAYGRQVDSFETDLDVPELGSEPFHAVFIRAPGVEEVGSEVEVLAEHDGRAVLARQGPITVAAFHPELSGDPRIHARFLEEVGAPHRKETFRRGPRSSGEREFAMPPASSREEVS